MKRRLFAIACVALLGLTGRARGQDREVLVKVGESVPAFEVELFDGGKMTTGEWRGKVVLLNFWATWCPPCIEEFRRIEELLERLEGKEFLFLAISREDTREQVEAFREKTGHRFLMGLDPEREVFSRFATGTIPRDFVINREGKIAYMTSGYTEKHFDELARFLETLLETP
jgi:peroxiredoxin